MASFCACFATQSPASAFSVSPCEAAQEYPGEARPGIDERAVTSYPDFGRRRIFAGPVVVGLEREFVLARQDIDKKAGKRVVPPCAAALARFFVDGEIDLGALQRLGHK